MNNYSDYYNYMNYISNSNNDGMNNYQGLSNNISYDNVRDNAFVNNFMMPSINGELYTPNEAIVMGNMFKNAYKPYKNYKPMKLEATSERGKLLNQILSYSFLMNELDLYLDLYPNNTSYIELYNEYRKIRDNLSSNYEKMYGPLTLDSNSLESNTWVWKNSPWPWEGEK